MQVKSIMTQNPACCTPDAGLQEVARIMVEQDCGAVPVVESHETGRPVGVVTDRDITCRAVAEGRNPLELRAGDIMSQGCVTVAATASVADCCGALEEYQVRRVVVVDETGCCCGIVSQADIARYSKQKAGEVVREVSQPTPPAAPAQEGGPGRDATAEEAPPHDPTNETAATAPATSAPPGEPVRQPVEA